MSVAEIPRLVEELYRVVGELGQLFPGRSFTPDGHLVGSIGEVLAEYMYELTLLSASSETHDARSKSGVNVQIKATQGNRVALSSCPEHLIVLLLDTRGKAVEVYNGPGNVVFVQCGKRQKNGQSPISLSKLKQLMLDVPQSMRLPVRNNA